MRRPTTPLLMSAICLVLVLSACDSESDPETATAGATDAGTDVKDPKDPKGPKDDGAAGSEETDPAELGANEGAACLVGTWLVDPQSVVDVTIAATALSSGGVDMDPDVTISGDGLMTYTADGRVTTEYRQQIVEMTVTVEGAALRSYGRTNGSMVASYTATDTELTTFDGDASGIELESETTVNGEPFDAGDLTALTIASWELGSTSGYVCSGDVLEVTPLATGFATSSFTARYTRQ